MTTTEHSGSGDLNRSLELLWDFGAKPARGPKPGLSLDRIVTAAVAVADAEGLDAVSMRRVAAELGVGTMSLYRYVPGKAELLDLMLDKVNDVGDATEIAPGAGWRAALEKVAHGSWRLYTRHPWLLLVDQARPVLGPNALAGLELALGGMREAALSDKEKMGVLVALDGYVSGCARSHLNSVRAEQRTGITDDEFWNTQAPILEKAMATGRYPLMAALADDTFTGSGEEIFEFGLQRLLDGLEAFVERRSG
ncbi:MULTISPECIES: TetR/AcrR family transcriptional regulator [unclassified Streptomyces]|uniref:TetR/AcrR family transcriptional regulator n=1 Tax=unclassified Streptomyces TaxID=2593676 RepID=UPI003FD175DD